MNQKLKAELNFNSSRTVGLIPSDKFLNHDDVGQCRRINLLLNVTSVERVLFFHIERFLVPKFAGNILADSGNDKNHSAYTTLE